MLVRNLSLESICENIEKFLLQMLLFSVQDDAEYSKLNDSLVKLREAEPSDKDKIVALYNQFSQRIDSDTFKNIIAKTKIDKKAFYAALYAAELLLASMDLINENDFVTLDEIAIEKKVVTSDRYQFDIDSLRTWKKPINPFTRQVFKARDVAGIQTIMADIDEQWKFENLASTPQLIRQFEAVMPFTAPPLLRNTVQHPYLPYRRSQIVSIALRFARIPLLEHIRQALAPSMTRAMNQSPPFILGIGDNFYSSGVDSAGVGEPQPSVSALGHFSPAMRQDDSRRSTAESFSFTVTRLTNPHEAHWRPITRSVFAEYRLPVYEVPAWYGDAKLAVKLPNNLFAIFENSHASEIIIINPVTNTVVRRITDNHFQDISSMALLPNGCLAVAHYQRDSSIDHVDPLTGIRNDYHQQISSIGYQWMFVHGNRLIYGDNDYNENGARVTILDLATGNQRSKTLQGLRQIKVMIEDKNKIIIAGYGADHRLCQIYDMELNLLREFTCACEMQRMAVLQNGNIVFAQSNYAYIYSPEPGVLVKRFAIDDLNAIQSMTVLASGNVVLAGANGIIKEFTPDGEPVREARVSSARVSKTPILLMMAYHHLMARGQFVECERMELPTASLIPYLTFSGNA